jgi:hypothetical protein
MKKIILFTLLAVLFTSGQCWAGGKEFALTVSGHSIRGDFQAVNDMADGFWKAGLSGIYTEDDETEYKWGEVGFIVGSDAFHPGLTCEVGMKGLIGKAEEGPFSGDVGTIAFTGKIAYDFAQQMTIPGSFELFLGLDYANEILSFMDTEDYMALHFGIEIPLFEHAAVVVEFSDYDMDMSSGPGEWDLDDDRFRLGLMLRF